MMLGESGVGKTTLVRFLTDDPEADNRTTTLEDFRVFGRYYKVKKSNPNGDTTTHDAFVAVADYRGQNLGGLFRGLNEAGKNPKSRMSASKINTLIFIVDLFPAQLKFGGTHVVDEEKRKMPDEDRIRQNIDKWSDEVLQIVFGSLDGSSLQSVCIFINKVDLISTEAGRKRAIKAFEPLVDRVSRRCLSLDETPLVLLGSLKSGEGCVDLKDHILRNIVIR